MLEQILAQLHGRNLVFLLIAVVVAGYFSYEPLMKKYGPYRRWNPLPQLPIVNLEGNNYKKALNEYFDNLNYHLEQGRKLYRDTGFQIWSPEGFVAILPEGSTEELKLKNDNVIDPKALARAVAGESEFLRTRNPHFLSALRSNLISKLAVMTPDITKKVDAIIQDKLGYPTEWTPTNAHKFVRKAISETSATTFVGDELGRDPEWLRITLEYTLSIGLAGRDLRCRSYFDQLLAPYLKGWTSKKYQDYLDFQQVAFKKIMPTLIARREALKNPDYKKPNDAIQWIIDDAKAAGRDIPLEEQAEQQTVFIFVSITTTASSALNAVYDLLSMPQYIQPLRDEIDQVVSECEDGKITNVALQKMNKLDSFIKESQRKNTITAFINQREVSAPEGLTLSSGLHLPKGTNIAVPTDSINRDPQIYKDPDTFQPWRYSDMRAAKEEDANRYFFTSTSSTQLNFGHGRHSCPGRFFASLEIKMLLVTMLRHYEWQPLATRPRGVLYGGAYMGKKDVDIYYKTRKTES